MFDFISDFLFPRLVNMSLTSGLIILAVMLARLVLRGAPRIYSYLLWSVVAFRLICPVAPPGPITLLGLPDVPMTDSGHVIFVASDVERGFTPVISADAAAPTPIQPMIQPEPTLLSHGAAALWLVGMAVLLAYSLISYFRLRRSLRTAIRLEGWVWQSDQVRSPFILGLFRPKIYMPFNLDPEKLHLVLAHEQIHLSRRDYIIKPLAFLLLILHWFNPLCWLAFFLMCRDMEVSCDEKVLSRECYYPDYWEPTLSVPSALVPLSEGSPHLSGIFPHRETVYHAGLSRQPGREDRVYRAYSSCLLWFAANRRFPSPSPLAFGESSVQIRIKHALGWKKPTRRSLLTAGVLCLALLLLCAFDPVPSNYRNPAWGRCFLTERKVFVSHDHADTDNNSFVFAVDPQGRFHSESPHLSALSNGTFDRKVALTPENFDALFSTVDTTWWRGWSTHSLRTDNDAAWYLETQAGGLCYLLRQTNGDFYLACGYRDPSAPTGIHMQWVLLLLPSYLSGVTLSSDTAPAVDFTLQAHRDRSHSLPGQSLPGYPVYREGTLQLKSVSPSLTILERYYQQDQHFHFENHSDLLPEWSEAERCYIYTLPLTRRGSTQLDEHAIFEFSNITNGVCQFRVDYLTDGEYAAQRPAS